MNTGSLKLPSRALSVRSALNVAAQQFQRGDLNHSETVCRQILQIEPENAEALHLLGVIAHQFGQHDAAAELIQRALKRQPTSPFFHCNLGAVLLAQAKPVEAAKCFRKALRLQPDYAEAHNNLAVALMQQGILSDASAAARRALAIRPEYAQAHYNLGLVLHKKGRSTEAISSYMRALELKPDHADALNDLGAALQEQGRREEATARFEAALGFRPDHAGAHNNLGTVLHDRGRLDEAMAHYEQALLRAPDLANVHFNLARVLLDTCQVGPAIACLEKAQQLEPRWRNRIAAVTAMSPIIESSAQLAADRERISRGIGELLAEDLRLADPAREGLSPNYLLAYHALDDRPLQAAMASVYLKACPSLAWMAPHCRGQRQRRLGGKIRIGFLSRFFYNHTVGEVMRGLIMHIDRERFDITLFRVGPEQDHISREIDAAADHLIRLPNSLPQARNAVAEQRLDALVYPEIGMDPGTYFLAFSRLAPLQCVMWGHPDTTGIPGIDCYLSAVDVEPDRAQDHYTEKLVTLQHIPTYYHRPHPSAETPDREALGLTKDAHLYICPQTLYKFHPDFDEILGSILRRDRMGLLVLFEGRHPTWSATLRERFRRTLPDVVERVRFLPRLALDRYFALLMQASAVLDTLHFGGGNTAYQAFGLGLPIVTLPGAFARGRITYALYKKMGIMDLVADSAEDYVELAVKLATDQVFRDRMSAAIRRRSDLIFERLDAVREFEAFFENATNVG